MLEIIAVLVDELVAERGRRENARGKVGGFVDSKAVDRRERVRVEVLMKCGVVLLGVLPFIEGGGY